MDPKPPLYLRDNSVFIPPHILRPVRPVHTSVHGAPMHNVEFKNITVIQNYFTVDLKFTLERPRIEEDDDGYPIVRCSISTDLGEAEFCEFIDDGVISNELMDQSDCEDLAELFHVEQCDDEEPKAMLIAHVLAEVIGYVMKDNWDRLLDEIEIQL